MKNIKIVLSAVIALGAFCNAPVSAQYSDYPNRPIRLITPAQPGGTTDILARLFGIRLTESRGMD